MPSATTSFVVTSAPASSVTLKARISLTLRAFDTAALRGFVTWASILPSTSLTSSLSMLSIANWRAWARVMVVLAMVTFFLDLFGPVLSGTLCPSHCLYNTPLGWSCQRLSSLHILTTNLKMLAQANFCGRHKELTLANFWRIFLQSNWCSMIVLKKRALLARLKFFLEVVFSNYTLRSIVNIHEMNHVVANLNNEVATFFCGNVVIALVDDRKKVRVISNHCFLFLLEFPLYLLYHGF